MKELLKRAEWIWNGEIGEVTKVESFTDRAYMAPGFEYSRTRTMGTGSSQLGSVCRTPPKCGLIMRSITPGTGEDGGTMVRELWEIWHVISCILCLKALNWGIQQKPKPAQACCSKVALLRHNLLKLTFPERERVGRTKMPEVEVYWYDGGIKPELPANWPSGKDPNKFGGGTFFYGSKDILHVGCYGAEPELLSGRVPKVKETERRVSKELGIKDGVHEQDWVRACKESPESRKPTTSDFAEAGPFNEMVVMGVMAVRLQNLNKELEWDGEKMQFTNISDSETIKTVIRDGFKIHDGHPTFDKTWTDPVPAKDFAAELVKHTYRDGWTLPEMPA